MAIHGPLFRPFYNNKPKGQAQEYHDRSCNVFRYMQVDNYKCRFNILKQNIEFEWK